MLAIGIWGLADTAPQTGRIFKHLLCNRLENADLEPRLQYRSCLQCARIEGALWQRRIVAAGSSRLYGFRAPIPGVVWMSETR